MSVEVTPDGTRGRRYPSGPVARWLTGVNVALYRLTRGRGMAMMLLLTTVGARSGRRRTTPVRYFAGGDDTWFIVASKGGAATHPAWYRNLARNPDQAWIEVGGRRVRVRPESLRGAEREERWRRIVADYPTFGEYEKQTDREIPVIRLRPASPAR